MKALPSDLHEAVAKWQAETHLSADWCAVAAVATAEAIDNGETEDAFVQVPSRHVDLYQPSEIRLQPPFWFHVESPQDYRRWAGRELQSQLEQALDRMIAGMENRHSAVPGMAFIKERFNQMKMLADRQVHGARWNELASRYNVTADHARSVARELSKKLALRLRTIPPGRPKGH